MDTAHDAIAQAARHLLAGLTVGASWPPHSADIDMRERLDALIAEHGPLPELGHAPVTDPSSRGEQRRRLFSLVGTLLGFGYAWGDLFPMLLSIHTFDLEPADQTPTSGEPAATDDLTAGHSFLLRIARSHLAALADGIDPVTGFDYDEALDDLDALYPPFAPPPILPVANLPRHVNYVVVVECVRQIAWHGVDPVGLLRVRTLLDAAWQAETRGLVVVGGAR